MRHRLRVRAAALVVAAVTGLTAGAVGAAPAGAASAARLRCTVSVSEPTTIGYLHFDMIARASVACPDVVQSIVLRVVLERVDVDSVEKIYQTQYAQELSGHVVKSCATYTWYRAHAGVRVWVDGPPRREEIYSSDYVYIDYCGVPD